MDMPVLVIMDLYVPSYRDAGNVLSRNLIMIRRYFRNFAFPLVCSFVIRV